MKRLSACLLALCTGFAHASPLPDYPFVSTSGKAQAWVKPDIGEIQFQANTLNPKAELAAAAMDQLTGAMLKMLAERGVASSDIETFDVSKKTVELSQPNADGATSTYAIARHVRVQVRDLAQWPAIMATLVAQEGVDSIGVGFDYVARDKLNGELAAQAAQDARGNGAMLAESFGRKLGPVVAIAKGPLDKIAAPFALADGNGNPGAAPRAPNEPNYAVPAAIPFAQSVNVIFKLK